jgi:hypothetical protein
MTRWISTRREWLAWAAGLALGLIALVPWHGPWRRSSPAERWLGGSRSIESAAAVGREYLRAAPHDRVRARLVAELDTVIGSGSPSDAEIRRRVSARIREDYAAGDTVRVRGWILSRTEARLCALAALS